MIEAEFLGDPKLSLRESLAVGRVAAVRNVRKIRGEHHGDRHQRQPVGGFAANPGQNTLTTVHCASSPRSAWITSPS